MLSAEEIATLRKIRDGQMADPTTVPAWTFEDHRRPTGGRCCLSEAGVEVLRLTEELADVERDAEERVHNVRLQLAQVELAIVGVDDTRWRSVFGLEICFKGKVGEYAERTRNKAKAAFAALRSLSPSGDRAERVSGGDE